MVTSNAYYTLMASLPPLPTRFDVQRLPISPARLEGRLKMLEPEDATVVDALRTFLFWDRHRRDWSDGEVVERYDQLMQNLENSVAREIVEFRMDTRTILSGLRRRRCGLPPPPGVGPWTGHIRRHWQQRDFSLGWRFPWIDEIETLLDTDHLLRIHHILLDHAWQHWCRLAEEHVFDFESLLLYLARWEVMARWTNLDSSLGATRFEELIEEATCEHRNIFQ